MTKLEFRLVVLEDGKEVFAEPLSSELLSTITNYYPDKISSRIFLNLLLCIHRLKLDCRLPTNTN